MLPLLLLNPLLLLSTVTLATLGTAPDRARFECLAAAYPDHIKGLRPGQDGHWYVDTSKGAFLWDDGVARSFQQRLATPDLQDTLALPYPLGVASPPGPDEDPGRFRVDGFLRSLYGATAGEVGRNLETVVWMPKHANRRLRFNARHGAAAALRAVSTELDALPERFHRYVKITAGTFNWRRIAGTERMSAHSYAIAIDIDTKHSDYWRWRVRREPDLPWRNKIPMEVVQAFERHGFVWGGRWFHYDTMHFEYRPELLHPACTQTPEEVRK